MKTIQAGLVPTLALLLTVGTAATGEAAVPREVKRIVIEAAAGTAVPASLALAVANVESGLRDDRASPEGARGVMQITPDMAARHGIAPEALWDARANVRLGLRILGTYFRESGHDWHAALVRYAAAIPGGLDGEGFARRVLSQERRFAEEIVVRNEIERRKRVVLKLADARGPAAALDRVLPPPAVASEPQRIQVAARTPRPVGPSLAARLAAARRTLDDFSAGNIPSGDIANDMLRERGRWSRR